MSLYLVGWLTLRLLAFFLFVAAFLVTIDGATQEALKGGPVLIQVGFCLVAVIALTGAVYQVVLIAQATSPF